MTEDTTLSPYVMRNQPESLDDPTDIEINASISLQSFLQERGVYESEEDVENRKNVLFKLGELVTSFVRKVYIDQNGDPSQIENVHGKIAAYGSFNLGIGSPDSDIDALCIVPKFVHSSHFFTVFFQMLKSQPLVKNLISVRNAFVPLIKMRFQDIDVDLAFASLATNEISPDMDDNYLENDSILNDIGDKAVRSLNGVRVSNMIRKLVPPEAIGSFGHFLRFIRVWAKERGIYGNVYGYLGGVNCAILCAFICQKYPKAQPASLILMFFQDLSTWKWPEPIYINTPNTGPLGSWDNNNGVKGKKDYMPIITPAYPSMNSLSSATKSSRNRMMKEFRRGYKYTNEVIFKGREWSEVAEPSNFFMQYRRYVEVIIWGGTKEEYDIWSGFVESKIRRLGNSLECIRFMTGVYIWPDFFDHQDEEGHEFAGSFFLAIEYDIPKEESIDRRIDISEQCQDFINELYKSVLRTEKMGVNMKLRERSMLPDFVFPHGRPEPKHKTKNQYTNF